MEAHCVIDNSGSMASWDKRKVADGLCRSLVACAKDSRGGWPWPEMPPAVWLWSKEVAKWEKNIAPAGSASLDALKAWLGSLNPGARVLLLGDGLCCSRSEGERFAVWLAADTNIKTAVVGIGPDCDPALFGLLAASGICRSPEDMGTALLELAGKPQELNWDMAEEAKNLAEDD